MQVKLQVRNIKKFGETDNVVEFELERNKLNLLFATNGVGKTSIATAFRYLNGGKYVVPIQDKHKKKDNVTSFTFSYKNNPAEEYVDLLADSHKDRISEEFLVYVLRNRVKAVTKAYEVDDEAISRSRLDVEKVVILDSVPVDEKLIYDLDTIKMFFGKKKSLLEDLSAKLRTDQFLDLLIEIEPVLSFSVKTQKMHDELVRIANTINALPGNARTVRASIKMKTFKTLEQYVRYRTYKSAVDSKLGTLGSKLDYYLLFFQLHYLYSSNRVSFAKALERHKYELEKKKLVDFFNDVRLPWNNVELHDEDGQLVAIYPLANEMSNGERDILSIVCQIEEFKNKLVSGKKSILIIDEVFDYLDDANMLAAEYYINELLLKYKTEEMYIVILSHLEVRNFRNHVFDSSKINQQYLFNSKKLPDSGLKGFIKFRGNLDMTNAVESGLYNRISRNLFHYSPDDEDISISLSLIRLAAPNRITGIKKKFYKKTDYNQYLVWELRKYLSNKVDQNKPIDLYAVCMAIRLYTEKLTYNKLPTPELKSEFISTHETLKKFEFCKRNNVYIPDTWRMIAAIHNDACHFKMDNPLTIESDKEDEKSMIYKLRNKVIKSIIANIFEYDTDGLVPLNALD